MTRTISCWNQGTNMTKCPDSGIYLITKQILHSFHKNNYCGYILNHDYFRGEKMGSFVLHHIHRGFNGIDYRYAFGIASDVCFVYLCFQGISSEECLTRFTCDGIKVVA